MAWALTAAIMALSPTPETRAERYADAFTTCAERVGVSPLTLVAMALHESGLKPAAVRYERNGSRSLGLLQLNDRYLPKDAPWHDGVWNIRHACEMIPPFLRAHERCEGEHPWFAHWRSGYRIVPGWERYVEGILKKRAKVAEWARREASPRSHARLP